eukprot:CCRYP_019248-RA/>CCRYP_019248-RA protein AED:0.55 eAED:0.29 QI:0/0/0/0.75/0/0/4/0/510
MLPSGLQWFVLCIVHLPPKRFSRRLTSTLYLFFVNHLLTTTASDTIRGKLLLKRKAADVGISIKGYHSDDGVSGSAEFCSHYRDLCQSIQFSDVGAHHQNGVAERAIWTVTNMSRANMLHATLHWPERSFIDLWPLTMSYAVWELFSGVEFPPAGLLRAHIFGCPAYVPDPCLQDGKKIPKWDNRALQGIFVGFSPRHSNMVPLILNPHTHITFHHNIMSFLTMPSPPSLPWQPLTKVTTDLINSSRLHVNASLNPQICLPRWTFLRTTDYHQLIWSTVRMHINMICFGTLHAYIDLLPLPPFQLQREFPRLPCHQTQYHLLHHCSMVFLLFQRETIPLCPPLFLMIQRELMSLCPPLLLLLVFPPEIVMVLGKTSLPSTATIPMLPPVIANVGPGNVPRHGTARVCHGHLLELALLQGDWSGFSSTISNSSPSAFSAYPQPDLSDKVGSFTVTNVQPHILPAKSTTNAANSQTYTQAINSPHAEKWWDAMESELTTLESELQAWELVPP